jgi:hypothetical protein
MMKEKHCPNSLAMPRHNAKQKCTSSEAEILLGIIVMLLSICIDLYREKYHMGKGRPSQRSRFVYHRGIEFGMPEHRPVNSHIELAVLL